MALRAKAGIDLEKLLDVVKPRTGDSMVLQRTMRLYLKNESMLSTTDLAVKDMNLAVSLARELGVPVESGETTEAIIARFRDDGDWGEDDMNEIIRDCMQRSGVDI